MDWFSDLKTATVFFAF